MNHSKYHQQIGATAVCNNIIMESTKGVGQRYIKGATKDCLFFTVGSPQRIRKKLQWNLVPTLLVWLKQIQKDSARFPFIILQRIVLEVRTFYLGAIIWYTGADR